MRKITRLFAGSAKELKSPLCLATTGLLIAVYILLEVFAPVNTEILKINFGFLAQAVIGMLYGPVVGIIAAIPCDILGAALRGNGLIPVFTLIAMFEGLIYGLFLYRGRTGVRGFVNLVAAQVIVVVISHMIFNTTALYMLGFIGKGGALSVAVITRAGKNLIELPVDIVLLVVILPLVRKTFHRITNF